MRQSVRQRLSVLGLTLALVGVAGAVLSIYHYAADDIVDALSDFSLEGTRPDSTASANPQAERAMELPGIVVTFPVKSESGEQLYQGGRLDLTLQLTSSQPPTNESGLHHHLPVVQDRLMETVYGAGPDAFLDAEAQQRLRDALREEINEVMASRGLQGEVEDVLIHQAVLDRRH